MTDKSPFNRQAKFDASDVGTAVQHALDAVHNLICDLANARLYPQTKKAAEICVSIEELKLQMVDHLEAIEQAHEPVNEVTRQ